MELRARLAPLLWGARYIRCKKKDANVEHGVPTSNDLSTIGYICKT